MDSTIWLALALVSILEGLGPMPYPKAWKKMVSAVTGLPDNILRRFDGGLVATGVVVCYMLRETIGWTKNRLIEVIFRYKKYCSSGKTMVESIFKQTAILRSE